MKNILLLHGALGTEEDLKPLATELRSRDFTIHLLTFRGHGHHVATGEFSIPAFASDIADYLKKEKLAGCPVFGYSMGGYAALYFALQYPELAGNIITLATKMDWDAGTAAREAAQCDEDFLSQKAPAFLSQLQARHHDHRALLQNTAALLRELGTSPLLASTNLSTIAAPVMMMVGEKDKMVGIDETLRSARSLTNGSLAVLPLCKHPLESAPLRLLAESMALFCAG